MAATWRLVVPWMRGIGPAPLPAVEIRLSDVEPFEAEAAQRRLLGVADGRLDLALAIGVSDAARQGDDARAMTLPWNGW